MLKNPHFQVFFKRRRKKVVEISSLLHNEIVFSSKRLSKGRKRSASSAKFARCFDNVKKVMCNIQSLCVAFNES